MMTPVFDKEETWWDMEKMLITVISFSNCVCKRPLIQGCKI